MEMLKMYKIFKMTVIFSFIVISLTPVASAQELMIEFSKIFDELL